jgi:hypothetical protein
MSVTPSSYAPFSIASSNAPKPANPNFVQQAYNVWKNISLDDEAIKVETAYGRLAMSGVKILFIATYLSMFAISYLTFWQNPSQTTPAGTATVFVDVTTSPNGNPALFFANSFMMAALSASTFLLGGDIYNSIDLAIFAGFSYAALTVARSVPYSAATVNNAWNRFVIVCSVLFAVFIAVAFFVGGSVAGAGVSYVLNNGEITAMPMIVWNDYTNIKIGTYNAFYVFSRIMTVLYIKYDWGMLSTIRNFLVMNPDALAQSKDTYLDPAMRSPSMTTQQNMHLAGAMFLNTLITNMATNQVLGYQVDPSTPFIIGIITGSDQGLGIRALGWTIGVGTAVVVWTIVVCCNNAWLANKGKKSTTSYKGTV